jgi:hypothetical protein
VARRLCKPLLRLKRRSVLTFYHPASFFEDSQDLSFLKKDQTHLIYSRLRYTSPPSSKADMATTQYATSKLSRASQPRPASELIRATFTQGPPLELAIQHNRHCKHKLEVYLQNPGRRTIKSLRSRLRDVSLVVSTST